MRVIVQAEPFDMAAELHGFGAGSGAVVTFTGIVRDDGGRMQALELEHYPGMTERAMTEITRDALHRFALTDVTVIHRHGRIPVGEAIMMVATAARHRQAAFDAAEFLMDYLKSRAPFWKKEIGPEGESWVAARQADEEALKRW
ncbi:molybdenum cofactor biosynthesis protein MoaE [Paenirhodobacter sp.]|uniref:molybdenum cofactor biosynthesis protein MoaE n=1 Tax=Paenirhodobacter sp. TaxID=1965326 RepID=UPI003B421E3A